MRQWLQKRSIQPAQEQAHQKRGPSSGISNQAMLSMLESQDTQTAPRPASGGTPLDEAMRAKFERQFGLPMDDVRIHHNSDEPAKFDAGAYTYGTDIFIGPGQEDTLEHEMTHVAQQKLGQVRSTGMEHGMAVNRSPVLEHSADVGTVPQMAGDATGPVVQRCDDDDQSAAKPPAKKRRRTDLSQAAATHQDVAVVEVQGTKPIEGLGTHSKKKEEQVRLNDHYKTTPRVEGKTYESEHAVGFAAVNHSGNSRRKMRHFEGELPAYQEVRSMHRYHLGTGSRTRENVVTRADGSWVSGFRFGMPIISKASKDGKSKDRKNKDVTSADEVYRDHQYAAVSEGRVGNAIQLNQLGYSVMYQHDASVSAEARKKADNSFAQMVVNLKSMPYYEKDSHQRREVQVTKEERAEMILARLAMQVGVFPSRKIENIVRKIFGIAKLSMSPEDKKGTDDSNDQKMLKMLMNMFTITGGD